MPRGITGLLALLARLGRITGPAHRLSEPLPDSGELGDMRAAYWQVHDDEAAAASTVAMARRLPALMRAALRLAWRASRADTIALIVCNLVAGSLTTTGLLATGRVLDHLLSTVPTVDRLRAAVPALLLVAGLATGRSVLLAVAGWSQERLRPMVDLLAEDELWQVTIRMDAAAFESAEINDAMLRARDQGTFRARMVVLGGSDLLTGLVSVAATIVTLAVLSPLLAPLAVLVTVPDAWAAIRVARLQYAANRAITKVRRRMWTLGDRMADRDSAVDVRAYTFGDWLLGEWRKVAEVGKREQLAIANRETRARLLADALTGLASVLIYVLLGVLLLTGMLSLAIAGTAVLALRTSRGALDSVMTAVNRLYEDGLYYGDLLEFQQVAKAHTPTATVPAPARFDQITVANVSFTYPGSDTRTDTDSGAGRPPLDGVSLTIQSGEVIALVGENGSGKSTLAKLLAAIYTPTAGAITWEDTTGSATDIATVDPAQLREHITLISQDHARWPLTARTNIAMGRPRDPERLRAAAEAGRAHRLITELPHGYDTLLDKRFTDGQDLSGGQWQRIAAARGIYRSGPGGRLIIADEPTSEVDAIAEHELLQSLLALRRPDRAIVLITHRMSSVQSADRIYVLDHGRILEHGTHATLMAAGGVYERMFTLQASRYQPASNRTNPSETHVDTAD